MNVERSKCRAGLVIVATLLTAARAYAAQTTGGVTWQDPLVYQKPAFVPITIPTIVTNYYVDMSAGSDTASCGTGTSNPCQTLRGLVDRNLSGLRGNATDGAAAINIRGTGNGAFYIFNNTLAGTPGREILIRPWGTSPVTFRRGGTNQGLNNGTVHDIIVDGGDPATGNMLFSFVADYGGCGGPCYALLISANNITIARTQFFATGSAGSGWPDLIGFCDVDGLSCSGAKFINNEFSACSVGSTQCSSIYLGPCTASGGCNVNNVLIKNNVIRHMGGEGIEVNPRTTSSNITIEGNAMHDNGYATCNDGGTRSCRPAIVLNINQSGAVNGVIIRNNLLWDLSSGCVWEKSGSSGANSPQIYNNTCYDYGKGTRTNGEPAGVSARLSGSTAVVRNNIIYAPNGTPPLSDGTYTLSNNVCASAASCGSASKTWSANTVTSTAQNDARFMRISSLSEASGAGINLFTAGVTVDYAGLPRIATGPFDGGAFMTTGGASPAAPTNLRIVP